MFSNRLPANLATTRLSDAIQQYRRSGRPLIDLSESNPTRAGFDYPPDLFAPLADPRAFSYAPSPFGLLEARRAVAAEYGRQGLDISANRIVLTASTSEAYSLLFKVLADAGDEVLIPRPSYPLFEHLTRLDAVVPRPYDLDYHGRWTIDLAGVERAITSRTRAILVVSPNNPTGSFLRRDEADGLIALAARYQLAIIADEVFAEYELEAGARAAAFAAAGATDALVFALGGLSKSIGLPQAKLAWIVAAGNTVLISAALERLEHAADTYLSVSTPVQVAAAELLRRGASIRTQIATRVRDNLRELETQAKAFPSCTLLRTEGGWYAVLQVPTFESEEELALRLLDAGVIAHPGYFFDFPRESFVVVSLLPRRDVFRDGVTRVLRHFACSPSADHHV